MDSATAATLIGLLAAYGYGAVLLCIALESMGIPLPGESMLLAAAVYAGTTHRLHAGLLVLAAATGAILGDNVGYVAGRAGGYRLLRRYGRYVRLDERRLKLGRYLFLRHGGKVVFFGRFVPMLRIWAAFLAGTNGLPWGRFLLCNAGGGVLWATVYGLGGYALGAGALQMGGVAGAAGAAVTVVVGGAGTIMLRRNERRLSAAAERALPGPLDMDTSPRRQGRAPEARGRGRIAA